MVCRAAFITAVLLSALSAVAAGPIHKFAGPESRGWDPAHRSARVPVDHFFPFSSSGSDWTFAPLFGRGQEQAYLAELVSKQMGYIIAAAGTYARDKFDATESAWLSRIFQSLTKSPPKVELRSARDYPGFFDSDPTSPDRIAKTELTEGATIYLNIDYFKEYAEQRPDSPDPDFFGLVAGIFAHELAHHLGVPDSPDRVLDRFGSKVGELARASVTMVRADAIGQPRFRLFTWSGTTLDRLFLHDGVGLVADLTDGLRDYLALALPDADNRQFKIRGIHWEENHLADEAVQGQPVSAILDIEVAGKPLELRAVFELALEKDSSEPARLLQTPGGVAGRWHAYYELFSRVRSGDAVLDVKPRSDVVRAGESWSASATLASDLALPNFKEGSLHAVLRSPELAARGLLWPREFRVEPSAVKLSADGKSLSLELSLPIPAGSAPRSYALTSLEADTQAGERVTFAPTFLRAFKVEATGSTAKPELLRAGIEDQVRDYSKEPPEVLNISTMSRRLFLDTGERESYTLRLTLGGMTDPRKVLLLAHASLATEPSSIEQGVVLDLLAKDRHPLIRDVRWKRSAAGLEIEVELWSAHELNGIPVDGFTIDQLYAQDQDWNELYRGLPFAVR